ncbi:MAG: helix-turn-helix domain-containing protein [Pseudonocardiaceae bacterium]|nr:helix-turn-helix domain-containing protein [Pseudonocardiaceae bacterium]
MDVARPSDLIQSASRALRIIDELSTRPEGLTARGIARRCECSLPTTYHLLRTLRYEGYVERQPGGRYVLGPKIVNVFRDFMSTLAAPPKVHNLLRHLAQITGQSVYFSQLVANQLVVTDVVEGPHSPHLEELMVHSEDSAHATALGKALLWSLPSRDRRVYLGERGLRPFTSTTVTDSDKLDAELYELARRRVFTEHEQYRSDVCCGAVLVGGNSPGAIGLSCGLERWRRLGPRLTGELRVAAADLQGYQPPAARNGAQN